MLPAASRQPGRQLFQCLRKPLVALLVCSVADQHIGSGKQLFADLLQPGNDFRLPVIKILFCLFQEMVIGSPANHLIKIGSRRKIGGCPRHGCAVPCIFQLHPGTGTGLPDHLPQAFLILKQGMAEHLLQDTEPKIQLVIQNPDPGHQRPCKMFWLCKVCIGCHGDIHPAAVQMNLTGQFRIAVMLRVHAAQHGFQKAYIVKILLGQDIRHKEHFQIPDPGGKKIVVKYFNPILLLFVPV